MKKLFKLHYFLCFLLILTCSSCAAIEPLPETSEISTPTELSKIDEAHWSDRAREVLMHAMSLTGIQYQYGGNSPETGFDCSGFVRYVFKQAISMTLPHSTLAISQVGKTVSKNELQPGDLVFFNTLRKTFSHVGIYLGNNRFIHSPSKGGKVRVDNMQESYWSKNYNGAQRIEHTNTKIQDLALP